MNAPAASDSSRGYDVVRNATRIVPANLRKIFSPVSETVPEPGSGPGSEAVQGASDAVGERGAVEAVETERFRRCAAGGPAIDAVGGYGPLQLAAKGVPQGAHGRVVLDDEDLLERCDRLLEPGCVE